MPGHEDIAEVHVMAPRAREAHRIPRFLDHRLSDRGKYGHDPRLAVCAGGQAHHAAHERGSRAARLEAPAACDAQAIRLLCDLQARKIAPGCAGAGVGEEFVAEPGIRRSVDQARTDVGMRRHPARRRVGLCERHADIQQSSERAPEPAGIARNQDFERAGAFELVGEIRGELARFLELEGASLRFGRQMGERGAQITKCRGIEVRHSLLLAPANE
jgi:hypothetical protein